NSPRTRSANSGSASSITLHAGTSTEHTRRADAASPAAPQRSVAEPRGVAPTAGRRLAWGTCLWVALVGGRCEGADERGSAVDDRLPEAPAELTAHDAADDGSEDRPDERDRDRPTDQPCT